MAKRLGKPNNVGALATNDPQIRQPCRRIQEALMPRWFSDFPCYIRSMRATLTLVTKELFRHQQKEITMQKLYKLFTGLFIAILISSSSFLPNLLAAQQDKGKPEKVEKTKTERAYPFHGKLSAFDKKAKSITLHGKEKSRTFYLTDKTKIVKNGKTATLEDAVVGEDVAGSILPDENGKLVLKSLRLGPKPEADKKPAKPTKDEES